MPRRKRHGHVAQYGGGKGEAALQISGLKAWFRADRIAGLNDGDLVTTWSDSSGNGNHATQATAANKPTYKLNIFNGQPVVRFAATDYLATSAFTELAQPNTVFIVATGAETNGAQFLDGIDVNKRHAIYQAGGATNLYAGATLNGMAHDSAKHVYVAIFAGASSKLYRDGGAASTGDAGAHALTGVTLAAEYTGNAGQVGDTSEFLLYAGTVAIANINVIGSGLASRYGITWTTAT